MRANDLKTNLVLSYMKIKLVSLNTKNFVSSIAFMLCETILIFMS